MPTLFSIAYLPPLSYIASIICSQKIIFEANEHYIKQTYRNRALIYSPNGILPLIIPVLHDELFSKTIHEVKISYENNWQKIHWRTITSCYRNSPYFDFFEDELKSFYEKQTETLFEFNLTLIKKFFALLQIPFQYELTSSYQKNYGDEVTDYRESFAPNKRNNMLTPYNQVFGERLGFIGDLSIIDLMFNKGLQAKEYLTNLKAR